MISGGGLRQDGSMPDLETVRVYLVDDHTLVRAGLERVLQASPRITVVGQAGDLDGALAEIGPLAPDVVTVDIALGRRSGLDLLTSMRAQGLNARSIVVTMHDTPTYAERALRAGALGFIGKDAPVDALHAAVLKVARGELAVPETLAQAVIARSGGLATEELNPLALLTDREVEVLRLLGLGKTTRDIADTLGISAKTVETHRVNIKNKLGIDGLGELIRFAVHHLEDPAEQRS
jgi:DNA-binding NarL/FixJ family response regulator